MSDTTTPTPAASAREIVFIDSRVKDPEILLEGLAEDVEVVYLDAQSDGLAQMAEALGESGEYSAVHVFAHGDDGQMWLGKTFLDEGALAGHADTLAALGRGLTEDGDLLLFACDLGNGEVGAQFVATLAELTGADVAASDDRTGAGGDWELEVTSGRIESGGVLSADSLAAYQHSLKTLTVTSGSDSGAGTLRAALTEAQNGDIVTFSTNTTVALNSRLVVNKSITIDGDLNNDGVADVTLDGSNRTGVIQITSGVTATLDGVVITKGAVQSAGANSGPAVAAADALGGGITNAGNLTLLNVTVTGNAAAGGGGGGGVLTPVIGGGGGGGGGIGGQNGAAGGGAGAYSSSDPSANTGGNGAAFSTIYFGGRGGNASGGGAGGIGTSFGYTDGGAGGTATAGGQTIGGGGGGSGFDANGGKGGSAAGGIFNDSTGILSIIGNSVISNNIGAGGGGGGGGNVGGNGGLGVGAIWNKGTVNITTANADAITGNVGGSGAGGQGASGGTNGTSPAAVNNTVHNDGGVLNTGYVADGSAPTINTIAIADSSLAPGETTTVTFTFSEKVFGLDIAEVVVPSGTLSNLSTIDNIVWTATLTVGDSTGSSSAISLAGSAVRDSAGNTGTGSATSNSYSVVDNVPPTAAVVVTDTALIAGETSLVTITFSESVSGFTNADLSVESGTLTAVSSSDGGKTWTATLTPDVDVKSASNQITLNMTGVQDLSGNAGVGSVPSNDYTVDTQRPTASISVLNNALRIGVNSQVNITFSEAVTGLALSDFSVQNGFLSNLVTSDNINWTATLTPNSPNTSNGNVIILNNTLYSDVAGNTGSGSAISNEYAVDTVRPTAAIVLNDNTLRAGDTTLVTITFSEAVTGFTNADLTVVNGALSAVSSSDGGINWTATFTPDVNVNDSTNVISLANTGVADLAGNAGVGVTDSENFTINTRQPTATVVVAESALALGDTSLVTITFSEAVTGFDNSDLTVVNGTLSAVSSEDGGFTWTATLTPDANVDDTSNVITLDTRGVTGSDSGNAGTTTIPSNNYAIDTLRPTATIEVADETLTIGQTTQVTITFSEAVTGFTNADLVVNGGSLSPVSSANGGITWTATLTPATNTSSASNLIILDNSGVRDQAGNAGSGTTDSNGYAVDTQRPTAQITMSDRVLTGSDTPLVTFAFSEAVTGFSNAALTVVNGTLSTVVPNGDGKTWTATFTPDVNVNDPTNLIRLDNTAVFDLAGNAGIGITTTLNFSIDTRQPTATVVVAESALALGETSLVTITFSEEVTGLTNDDLTVANGTLSAVSSADGGRTWIATLTPAAGVEDDTNVITVDTRGVTGVASGNAGTTTIPSNNYAIDTLRPTATIEVADETLAIGQTTQVTITFSEAVTGFTNADLVVRSGNLSAVSSADGGVTWTATLTPALNTSSASNLITLDNSGVRDQAGNAGSGSTDSNEYAVDTQRPTAQITMSDWTLTGGETSVVTITFTEPVTGFTNAALTVPNGTLSPVSSSDGGKTWTATLTPDVNVFAASNQIALNRSGATDAAGNPGESIIFSDSYSVDTRQPTATVVVAESAMALGETSLVTITFSEKVDGFTNDDLTVANGTLSDVSTQDDGITWTATLTPAAGVEDNSNIITLDTRGVTGRASGNAGTTTIPSNNYAIDTSRPTATIVVGDDVVGIDGSTDVTITFSEAVMGFTNTDLNVVGGSLSAVSSADGGTTWTATFTPAPNTSIKAAVIALNNAGIADLAGNAGVGVTTSNEYVVDTQAPTATVAIADTTLTAGETARVTITFSEAVPGLTIAALTVPNGTLAGLSTSDGGITWTATLTPTPGTTEPSNLITLDMSAVVDTAGNAGTGTAESGNYAVDTTVPPPPVTPVNPPTSVDGAQVSVSVGSDGSTTTTIAPVVDSRVDDPATANVRLADVTVVRTSTGVALLDVGLPVGTGVTANGPANLVSAANAQSVLARQVTGASGTTEQQASAQAFLASLPADTQVVVQTVTVTAQVAAGGPLMISALNTQDGHRTAVVVDTRSLPAGTLIDLENIDFAVIVGNARVTGGAGANIAYGDDDSQFIVLGEGDDVLHGQGGNDTVGSLRGNDRVFGDAGDDIVYGGSGDDTLTGGTGNDAMNGGFGFDTGVQSGARADYTVRTENGSVILTHRTSGEVDRFTDVERITFDSGKAIVVAHEASDVADLRARFGSDELIELNLTRAVPGSDANDVVTPTLGVALNIDLGAGQDVVKLAGGRDDVHLDVEAGQVVHLTRLEDGAMLGLKNVELLEFANGDVTVLAQNHDQAIVGRAYELLLGRNVDVAGFQFWAEALDAGVSLQSVLQLMVTSQEAADVYKLANGNFIEQLYVQGLDRASDAAGKAYWADALASGVSRAVVLEGFAGSAEAVEVIGSTVDVNVVS